NRFYNYRKRDREPSISHNQIRKLELDEDGNIWIGTFGEGVDVLNPVTGTIRHIKAGDSDQPISSNFILTLYNDLEGNMWIGTLSGGLNCSSKKENKFQIYTSGGADAISDNIIRAIYQ